MAFRIISKKFLYRFDKKIYLEEKFILIIYCIKCLRKEEIEEIRKEEIEEIRKEGGFLD
jgi:hypothetical protein